MNTIFHLDASMRTLNSTTRALSQDIVIKLAAEKVIRRDLAIDPAALIDAHWIDANTTVAAERSDSQIKQLKHSDSLLQELIDSDVLVFGIPMYNFGIPAALKAWIDQVCRAGVSFRYTDNGPEGLLKNKRAILAIASGGVPIDSMADHTTPYMRQFLNFIGVNDIEVIAADAMAVDTDSLTRAKAKVAALAA